MTTLRLGTINVPFWWNPNTLRIEKLTREDSVRKWNSGEPIFMFQGKPSALAQFMRDTEEFCKVNEETLRAQSGQ